MSQTHKWTFHQHICEIVNNVKLLNKSEHVKNNCMYKMDVTVLDVHKVHQNFLTF